MSLSISATLPCHANHLFSHPFCKNQSLLKRVANAVFHIFTLGIPLLIHHVFSWCFPKATSKVANLNATAIQSVKSAKGAKPYSPLAKEALRFSRNLLKNHPKITLVPFSAYHKDIHTHQPINQEILLLNSLYWDVAFKHFDKLMRQNKKDPWKNPEVIKAADTLMKIGFAISNLTLDDLHSFTEDLSSKGKKRTYAEALTIQDSYQYRMFFYCTNVYHWLRGGLTCSDKGAFVYPDPISEAQATCFYQEGKIQHSWNRLYNEYCERIRMYVPENELKAKDPRHANWTQKDNEMKSFDPRPDTQPT